MLQRISLGNRNEKDHVPFAFSHIESMRFTGECCLFLREGRWTLSDKNSAMTKEIFLLSKSRWKFQCYCVIIKYLFVSEVGVIYISDRFRKNL